MPDDRQRRTPPIWDLGPIPAVRHRVDDGRMTTRWLLLLSLALALPAPAQTLEKIRKAGTITLGYVDNEEPRGYSVDLCRAVAEGVAGQLQRPSLKTRWVKLTVQNRIDAVRKGQVDVECSTTTWTLARQRLVDFSLVTFVDGGSILTKAA